MLQLQLIHLCTPYRMLSISQKSLQDMYLVISPVPAILISLSYPKSQDIKHRIRLFPQMHKCLDSPNIKTRYLHQTVVSYTLDQLLLTATTQFFPFVTSPLQFTGYQIIIVKGYFHPDQMSNFSDFQIIIFQCSFPVSSF